MRFDSIRIAACGRFPITIHLQRLAVRHGDDLIVKRDGKLRAFRIGSIVQQHALVDRNGHGRIELDGVIAIQFIPAVGVGRLEREVPVVERAAEDIIATVLLKAVIEQQVLVRDDDQRVILFRRVAARGVTAFVREQFFPSRRYLDLVDVYLRRVGALAQVHGRYLARVVLAARSLLLAATGLHRLHAYERRHRSLFGRVDIQARRIVLLTVHELILEHHQIIGVRRIDFVRHAYIIGGLVVFGHTETESGPLVTCLLRFGIETGIHAVCSRVTKRQAVVGRGTGFDGFHIHDCGQIDLTAGI